MSFAAAVDFAVLPPEINSGRMYSGPGSESMVAAAAAWDRLAAELRSAATSYSAVTSALAAEWLGPSSTAMAAAAAPYMAWMKAAAAQAEQAGAQARAAAVAYQSALASTVSPQVIAANRVRLESLVATNLFGQNNPAIAATETQYADMWAQDAAAMYGYASSAAAATRLTPFSSPPQIANPVGPAGQVAAVAPALSAFPALPPSIKAVAAAGVAVGQVALGPGQGAPVSAVSSAMSMYAQNLAAIVNAAKMSGASSPGLGALATGLASGGPALGSAASADMAGAGAVGGLSVPPSWVAATPVVRLAAVIVDGTNAAAAPAVALDRAAVGQLALGSLAGSALGAGVPRAISAPTAKGGRPTPNKESQMPDKLKRVLADLPQKPGSVQHWHTDNAHLESLLDQLSKKPGFHAVHLSHDKPKSPKPRWG